MAIREAIANAIIHVHSPVLALIDPDSGFIKINVRGGQRQHFSFVNTGMVQRHRKKDNPLQLQYLKSQKPDVKVVAVEPQSSAVLSTGVAGAHKIQGIGAGFVPDVLNTAIYDEIIPVTNEDAFATGKLIGKKEGVLVGISSGAAAWAAIELAKRPENTGKTIIVLLPDTGDRYLSTPLFAE